VAYLLDQQSQILRENPLTLSNPARCFSIRSTAGPTMTDFNADLDERIIRRDDK
jgi:hypothetical protein